MSASRMRFLRRFSLAISVVCLALAATGCGGGATNSVTPSHPAAATKTQIRIGDAPADSVLAFELQIARIDLTQQDGTTINVLSVPTEIELTHLAGTVEPLAVANVPAGTYSGAAITVSSAEVAYLPSGSKIPVEKEFSLDATFNVPFSPAISLGANASILNFDVNVAQSLTFDQSGNVTGVSPVFTVTAAVVAQESEQNDENGKADDMVGVVSSITPASESAPASFAITPQSGGTDQSFTVDDTTEFGDGLAQFADLKVGMLVQVDAVSQSDGTLLAKQVEMVEASDGLEADGIVTATTGNPVTSLSLLVQDEEGNIAGNLVGTSVSLDVSNAVFTSPANEPDFANLLQGLPFTPQFDNTTVTIGQHVELDGASVAPVQGNFSANEVKLQEQALSGTAGPAANGSNASFSLLLGADAAFVKLTGQSSLNVYQVAATELKGMASVAQGSNVRVRGLLFFDGTNYQFVAARISLP